MKAYQNKKTGVLLRKETYNSLTYSEQLDYVKVEIPEQSKSSDLTDVLLSGAIGYATGSALLGGFLGGSFEGGIAGDLLEGGGLFD
jgi:hypothetical protein